MNNEYIELDNHNGFVTDDHGRIDFVSTDCNSEISVDYILVKENELEKLTNELTEYETKLSELMHFFGFDSKFTIISRELLFILLMVTMYVVITDIDFNNTKVLFNLSLKPICYFIQISLTLIGGLIIFKDIKEYINNKKELSLIHKKINDIKSKILESEKTLKNIKNKAVYKRINKSNVITKVYGDSVNNINYSSKRNIYKRKVLVKYEDR